MKRCRSILFVIIFSIATVAGFSPASIAATAPSEATDNNSTWTCPSCGQKGNKGKFCSNCGTKKPEVWTCPSCGHTGNTGKFCPHCGTKKPEIWTCPSCGHSGNKGKFCSHCGTKKPGEQTTSGTVQAPSSPAIPAVNRRFQYVSIVRTDGNVSTVSLKDSPKIYFNNSQIWVGSASYSLDKVQRLEYSNKATGVRTSSDYSSEKQKAVFFYRNDGQFNAFEQKRIKRIEHSAADTVQVVTADSLYKIPIAVIDSVSLHSFETVYNPKVIKLGPYEPYVQAVSVEDQTISFKKSLPEAMKPKAGDILYCEAISSTFPDGYAGKVLTTDGYNCRTEIASIDDIYEKVLLFGSYVPEDDGKKLAMASASAPTAKGPLAAEGDDDLINLSGSMGFNMGPYEYTVKKGAVTATMSAQFSPAFTVAIVKTGILDNARVHVGIDVDYQMGIEVSASGSKKYEADPTIPLIKPIPIPDFPIVSVGIDLQTFAEASLSGKITAGVNYFGGAHVTFDFCDGKMNWNKRLENGSVLTKADAEAKGELYLGLGLLPNLQLTGWMLKAGPTFFGGPKFVLTLPVNSDGNITCAYDVLKEATLDLYAKATFTAKVIYKMVGDEKPESKSLDGLSPEVFIKRWYFVPLFTNPACADPLLRENVTVSTTASRELLLPVEIGCEVKKGNAVLQKYIEPVFYEGPQSRKFSHKFSGFDYEVEYTAVPTVGLFGHHLEATPVSTFIIHPEVRTEDPINVTINSATIVGSFPDINNNFKNYGIRYAPDGGQWVDFKTPRQDQDAFFRVNLNSLKENTLYKVQAYLIENGNTYYGEEKTFLTRESRLEFKNPGSYKFEWQWSTDVNSSGEKTQILERKGYYERKGSITTEYICDYPFKEKYYNRLDDQSKTYGCSIDGVHWDDGDGSEPGSELSLTYYKEQEDGRSERIKEARELGCHYFNDALGRMAFFCEDYCKRMKKLSYTDESLNRLLQKNLIGTDTVAGVLCNVYAVEYGGPFTIWVDPETSLTLRIECDDYFFEVTSFKIDGFDLGKL